MDQDSLVIEEIDAGAKLVCEFDKYRSVAAAFWLKVGDAEQRYLYIASDKIDDTNLRESYGEILRLTETMRSPYLDPFRVKLIGAENPLAKAAAVINKRFPGRMATSLRRKSFGGISVDDAYIYPSPLLVSA